MTLVELANAGWPVARLAYHFCIRHGDVRRILASADVEVLPVRRRCTDALPVLPSPGGDQDAGSRVMQLMRHWLTG